MKRSMYIAACLIVGIAAAIATKATLCSNPVHINSVPHSFDDLLDLSDAELQKIDIAHMNLLCALGLPGAENLDIEQCLQQLDTWAKHVKAMEQRYMPAFQQNRAKYSNSPALFKGVYLGIAIEQDFHCGYNDSLLDSGAMDDLSSTRFFADASDIFINGLIEEGTGSCASLPVLMVALGRRCGYPMHLVACGGHLFCRWDGDGERVNLEITCDGVNTHADVHYRNWPRMISDVEIAQEHLMCNLANREMLGLFASLRGACLKEHDRYEEALACYRFASRCLPDSRIMKLSVESLKETLHIGDDP